MVVKIVRITENRKGEFIIKMLRIINNNANQNNEKVYYITGTKHPELNKVVNLDMTRLKIVSHEHMHPDTGEKYILNWLHLK